MIHTFEKKKQKILFNYFLWGMITTDLKLQYHGWNESFENVYLCFLFYYLSFEFGVFYFFIHTCIYVSSFPF